jgi:hypothetical protein
MTPVILIFTSDVSHQPLESCGVPFLVILVNKIGVDHFMNQGPFNLINIVIHLPEQLVRQVNLGHCKLLTTVPAPQHSASFVSAVSCGCGHARVPHNRNVWNLTIEVLKVQTAKHC